MDNDGNAEIMDFGSAEPKPFRVGGVVYTIKPDIPLDLLEKATQLSSLMDSKKPAEVLPMILDFFDEVLTEDSAPAFRAKVQSNDGVIGLTRLPAIMKWVVESFGLRPTLPSADSSIVSVGGTSPSLTAGV